MSPCPKRKTPAGAGVFSVCKSQGATVGEAAIGMPVWRTPLPSGQAVKQAASIGRGDAPDKDLDPAFPQLRRTVVLPCPHIQAGKLRQRIQQGPDTGLVHIREATTVRAVALPLTVLEIEEHHAAGTQGTLQTPQDIGQIRRGHMQQAGTGPDTVETLLPCHVFEAEHRHLLPQQERCLPESQRVPPRAATGIEDEPAGAYMRQKTGIQRRRSISWDAAA